MPISANNVRKTAFDDGTEEALALQIHPICKLITI